MTAIDDDGYDRERVTERDPVDVLAMLSTHPDVSCAYVDVLRMFGGDHGRARTVLRDLEQTRLIQWGNNGRVRLSRTNP